MSDEGKRTIGAMRSDLYLKNDLVAGRHSDGKLSDDDRGDAFIGISEHAGNVRIDFTEPMQWLALEPDAAIVLAEMIIERAKRIAARKGAIK